MARNIPINTNRTIRTLSKRNIRNILNCYKLSEQNLEWIKITVKTELETFFKRKNRTSGDIIIKTAGTRLQSHSSRKWENRQRTFVINGRC